MWFAIQSETIGLSGSEAVLDFRLASKRVLAMRIVCRPPTATYITCGRLFNEAVEWIQDLLKSQGDRVGP